MNITNARFVTLKSYINGLYMIAPKVITLNLEIECKADGKPITFIQVETDKGTCFQVLGYPLFLSYKDATGRLKYYDTDVDSYYSITPIGSTFWIENKKHNQYMWLSETGPYINKEGKDHLDDRSRWYIEPKSW